MKSVQPLQIRIQNHFFGILLASNLGSRNKPLMDIPACHFANRVHDRVESVVENRTMSYRAATLLLLACLAKAESASDESWKNLRHTVKESTYTVAMRDGRCVIGHVESVDNTYITVGSFKLDRQDVLRIGDGTSVADHDPIYSGRSSWVDLQRSEPNKYERIQLELKKSATLSCRNFSANEEEATCDGSRIGKAEVARGYYVRLAPATEWEHHVVRENVPILAPRTWFDFALFPRIKVLLYDQALAQENAKVECKVP